MSSPTPNHEGRTPDSAQPASSSTRPITSTTTFQWGIPPPPSAVPPRRPIPTSTAPLPVSPPVRLRMQESPWVQMIMEPPSSTRRVMQAPDIARSWTILDEGMSSSQTAAFRGLRLQPPVARRHFGVEDDADRLDHLDDLNDHAHPPWATFADEDQVRANVALRRLMLEPVDRRVLRDGAGPRGSRTASGSGTPPTNVETFERHRPRIISSMPQRRLSASTSTPEQRSDRPPAQPGLAFLANTLPHHKAYSHTFDYPHLPSYLQSHPRAHRLELPTVFNDKDKHINLSLTASGLSVAFTANGMGDDNDASAIRTTTPIPPNVGIYYYEVKVMDKGELGFLSVGFSKRNVHLNRLVGWEPGSWGWHGDDGRSFEEIGEGKRFGPMYTTRDIVGAGINFVTGRAFFTKNGELIGHAFSGLDKAAKDGLYPSVGLRSPREVLRANFTGPFEFDIDAYYQSFRDDMFKDAIAHPLPAYMTSSAADLERKGRAQDVSPREVLPPIISAYLKHNGFSDVSHKFDQERERRRAAQAAPNRPPAPLSPVSLDTSESLNYVLRLVHDLIVIDEIKEATRIVRTGYPKALEMGVEGGKWGFWLEALAFIKLLRTAEKSSKETSKPTEDEDMEVDGILTSPGSGSSKGKRKRRDSNASSSPPADPVITTPLDEALDLGSRLRMKWGKDAGMREPLAEVFALFGKTSVDDVVEGSEELSVASKERREWVADGLVRAIRVMQGAPTRTALEQIYRRTDNVLALLASAGDAHTAFADVKWVMDGKAP